MALAHRIHAGISKQDGDWPPRRSVTAFTLCRVVRPAHSDAFLGPSSDGILPFHLRVRCGQESGGKEVVAVGDMEERDSRKERNERHTQYWVVGSAAVKEGITKIHDWIEKMYPF